MMNRKMKNLSAYNKVMCSKFSMLMPVAYWLLHGGVSLLMSEIWEMSPCKKIVQAFTLWHDLLIDDVLDILL